MFFIIGLCLASFLNVVVERTVRGEKWLWSRSKCNSCGHVLAWYDLIPVLSWIFLKGKCRYCKNSIPARYPLSELALGIALLLSVKWYYLPFYKFYIVAGFSVLFLSVLTDIYDRTVYDIFTLPFAGIFLLANILFFRLDTFILSLFGGITGFVIAIILSNTKKVGQGDVTLLLFAGIWLGLIDIIRSGIFAALVFGATLAFLSLSKGKPKEGLPLTPFLFIGVVLNFYF